jgi:hypothetical protein
MSLTYNPNVDISYHQSVDQSGPNNMQFPRDGNFKAPEFYSNTYSQQMPPMQMQQMQQMPMQQMPMMQPPMPPMYNPVIPMQKKRNIIKEKFASDTKPNKINWILITKKIVIYTMLFLIMSHIKMNEIIFKFIPFFEKNEIPNMIFKGFIMAIIIIITQMFL